MQSLMRVSGCIELVGGRVAFSREVWKHCFSIFDLVLQTRKIDDFDPIQGEFVGENALQLGENGFPFLDVRIDSLQFL